MPKVDHRLDVRQHFGTNERLLVRLMLKLMNPLRVRLELPPLTQADLMQELRQLLREQD